MTRVVRRPRATRTDSDRMKAFLDSGKRETRILGPVERHLLAQPPSDRRTDVLHPSEMAKKDWCHRASYFLLKGRQAPAEVLRLQRENVFAEGHEIHRKWQGWLADMGALVGRWWCLYCGLNAEDFGPRPDTCWHCHRGTALEYREVSLRSQEHRIAGHADGWVHGLGDEALIEIKSVGTGTIRMEQPTLLTKHGNDLEAVWKSIRRPFPSHFRQGQIYLALAELLYGSNAPKEIVFIYEYKLNQSVKEFCVEYDPESVAHLLDIALDIVWAVSHARPIRCPNDREHGCAQCRPLSEAS